MAIGEIAPALLEDWLRDRYFQARLDISCSGVETYSLGEVRAMLGLGWEELDLIDFRDSPSLGSQELREAVAARFAPGHAGKVMVTSGSSEAIFLSMTALIRPGDEIVVMRPVYQSLVSIAEALGARLKVWELPGSFVPDLGPLRGLLTPRTRAIVVNFPHNPTGTTLTPGQYQDLLELVSEHGCHLFWDGAFAELVYDEPPLPDPAGVLGRCVSFGTLSKAYGLPGLRVGWCFAPRELLAEMVRVRDYLTLNLSPLNDAIAAAVLRDAGRFLTPRMEQARQGRDLLLQWAREHADLVSLPVPRGGVSAFPRLKSLADVTDLCTRLARDHGVLVVPGRCFGHADRIRVGFGGSLGQLKEGLWLLAAQARRAKGASDGV
ncbi:capreomycidine synthase [Nonomuraea sp. NPDC050643]|uniref:capreomycidine synthase n=1 Tax=Nonomuraea sp. NPDC050643 TaxID=3155660 RepID=UPI0033C99934